MEGGYDFGAKRECNKKTKEKSDDLSVTVFSRMENCADLVAEEAIYHVACYKKFFSTDNMHEHTGRPLDEEKMASFTKLCEWLERDGDCELHTGKELLEKVKEFSIDDINVYSERSIRRKLKDKYKDHIYFTELPGRETVIGFKDMVSYVLFEKKKTKEETKESIIIAAAKIIKAELREMEKDNQVYPTIEDLSTPEYKKKWVPESLQLLLQYIIPSSLKQVNIGQCITQASRPRSIICPILFGLGVQVEKSFGSKWLINLLHRLGYSISYDEVTRFKQSAIEAISTLPVTDDGSFYHWVADNVDHNQITLTGKGTFHGMGVISISSSSLVRDIPVKRIIEIAKTSSIVNHKGIPIICYESRSEYGLLKLKLDNIEKLSSLHQHTDATKYNLLWNCSWFFRACNSNWSGFMQSLTKDFSLQRKDKISFLPIIDLNPSDESCIYSTIIYVCDQAKKFNIPVPSITFDQPLWLKASGIIEESKLNIVCRLGGFHTMMSFMGSIGSLMKGSGLESLFAEVYSENTVGHIFTGKAVSRALRAHFLAEAALTSMLLDIVFEEGSLDQNSLMTEVKETLNSKEKEDIERFLDSSLVQQLKDAIEDVKSKLSEQSRTAKLWILYLNYISTIKKFVFAERTSNWSLHLDATKDMLNLFASSGHIHYAKCGRFYVQKMQKLCTEFPWMHQQFENGYHAVRRSKRHWSGLWTDLTIEQTLMRSIKTQGGLTRGRGMSESVRNMWTLSLNSCAAVHDSMMDLTGLVIKTSEQHVDVTEARRSKDSEDYGKFICWLENRNPFHYCDKNLHSLSTGFTSIAGKDAVNCDESEKLGEEIHKKLNGENMATASIQRKDQFKSLESLSNTIKIDDRKESINPTILFTRLTAMAQREEDVEKYFEYEMSPSPPSLFKDGLMRKPDKASLRKAVMKMEDAISKEDFLNPQSRFVLDGGALLHRVRWAKNALFRELAKTYVSYVRRHYGLASIVFDGYSDLSTKDSEHARRSQKKCHDVEVKEINQCTTTQDRFLSNENNKTQFIALISQYLRDDNQNVINCNGDADTTIVKTAIDQATASVNSVVVVADDTDIAIMLLYHWKDCMADIVFYPDRIQKGWSMKSLTPELTSIKEHLLFIHAWSGCDTVSAPYGKGKPTFLELFKKSKQMQDISTSMTDVWASVDEIGQHSKDAFLILYHGKKEDTLTKLRYTRYMEMMSKGVLQPEKMPPTNRAAFFHGLRAHYQIVIWKMLNNDDVILDPKDWGWLTTENAMSPVKTDKKVAPNSILKVVRCNCKSSSIRCGSNRCSCRKNSLKCMSNCGECRGVDCENREVVQKLDADSDGDDEERNPSDLFI